jgi:CarboxypepD_reg-like domain/Secretion system C-terminal sorting domain
MKKQLLTLCACFLFQCIQAQKSTIFGQALDAFSDEPIIGATVRIHQGDKLIGGTITDLQGQFRAEVPEGVYDLEFSFLGMSTEHVKQIKANTAAPAKPLHIWLGEDQKMLGEVVITAQANRRGRGCGTDGWWARTNIIYADTSFRKDLPLTNSLLSCYPNPTSSGFSVEITEGAQAINCFQTDGKLVFTAQHPQIGAMVINTNNWQSGTYIVQMVHSSGSQVGKLVVQHL